MNTGIMRITIAKNEAEKLFAELKKIDSAEGSRIEKSVKELNEKANAIASVDTGKTWDSGEYSAVIRNVPEAFLKEAASVVNNSDFSMDLKRQTKYWA